MMAKHGRRRATALIMVLAALVAGCVGMGDGAGGPDDLAITNVTVVDAVNGAREAQTVLVTDGRIRAVLPADGAEATDAAARARQVVDGTGRHLIPGLWDFHVHLTYDARFTEAMPGLFLHHGITSIRDTGGSLELVKPVVEQLRADSTIAPRVFFAGPLLDGEVVVYDGVNEAPLGIANPDPVAARANVARLDSAGVDFVKIYEMVSPEVFAALADEARARGLAIDGHVPLSMRAGDVGPHVQSLEHLRNLELDCAADPEALLAERRRVLAEHEEGPAIRLRSQLHRLQRLPAVAAYDEARCDAMIEAMRTTIQVPTLRLNALSLRSPLGDPAWSEVLDLLPADVAEEWGAAAETFRVRSTAPDTTFAAWSLFLVGRMHTAGVPIGAGTDTPIGYAVPGRSLHDELDFLVRAGLSPREALHAATVQPARFFGLEGELGTIETGRLADLVLLTANPLDDIGAVRAIEAVVTKGRLLDRTALDAQVAVVAR